jgi:hypothetical protein
MRDERAGPRQKAGAEGAQADEAFPLIHPAARCTHPQEVARLERNAGRNLLRSLHLDQGGNRASAQDQAFTSTSWLAGQSSESAVVGGRPMDC